MGKEVACTTTCVSICRMYRDFPTSGNLGSALTGGARPRARDAVRLGRPLAPSTSPEQLTLFLLPSAVFRWAHVAYHIFSQSLWLKRRLSIQFPQSACAPTLRLLALHTRFSSPFIILKDAPGPSSRTQTTQTPLFLGKKKQSVETWPREITSLLVSKVNVIYYILKILF